MEAKTSPYEILTDIVRNLYEAKNFLKQKGITTKEEYAQLESSLSNWAINTPLVTIERELNELIAAWKPVDSIRKLTDELEVLYQKISYLDREIPKITVQQEKLQQRPDRYGNKEATNEVVRFLQSVKTAHLSDLDEIINNTIPGLYNAVGKVDKAFRNEATMVENNQEIARKLIESIETYNQYVDRFNLRNLCEEGRKVAEKVINSPDITNPDSDLALLNEANQNLNLCIGKFEEENLQFNQLLQTLANSKASIWTEDYASLEKSLMLGCYHQETPISLLQQRFSDIKGRKEKDISQTVLSYSKKIQKSFAADIKDLINNPHSRQDFNVLKAKMDKMKVKENLEAVKVAVVLAVVFIAVILVIVNIDVVLPIAIFIGILFIIYLMIRKKPTKK